MSSNEPASYAHMTPSSSQGKLVATVLPGMIQGAGCDLWSPTSPLPGMGAGYLRNCLSPMVSAWSIRVNGIHMLWVLLIEQCHILEPRQCGFSVATLALWNEIPSDILTLMAFWRVLTIWLYSQTCPSLVRDAWCICVKLSWLPLLYI